ncbi:MAG: phosphoribosyltransferase family protein [Patescibacteria group bacterium]
MKIQYLPVTWKDYHVLCQKIAAAILNHEKRPFDEIVAIGRGGLNVGLIMSDFLRIPLSSITIQSYTDIKKHGVMTITEKLGKSIEGSHILLVDDNADSGKTFIRAIEYLKTFHPASITTASLFYKPWSTYQPDYFAKRTTRWILFPHEVTEWIYTFTQKMEKEGKSKADIQTFLESLGYSDSQIKFVRRHHLK